MTDNNPRSYVHAVVLGGFQRHRRWPLKEKFRMVEETFLHGNSGSRVARTGCRPINYLVGAGRRQAAP